MMLPGDQLWNQYVVESVAADGSAWLAPLFRSRKPSDRNLRFLLLPLSHSNAVHPLIPLLRAMLPNSAQEPSARLNAKEVPMLGTIQWIGARDKRGVAIVPAPRAKSLLELVEHGPPPAPVQILRSSIELAENLIQLAGVIDSKMLASGAFHEITSRLLNPETLSLSQEDSSVRFSVDIHRPDRETQISRWYQFLALELFSGVAHAASPVFALAHTAAFWFGVKADQFDSELIANWAPLAEWASGRRDPAREFSAASAMIPSEFRTLLAQCLDKKTAHRPANMTKLLPKLEELHSCQWARAHADCENCGFFLSASDKECPCCGTVNTDSETVEVGNYSQTRDKGGSRDPGPSGTDTKLKGTSETLTSLLPEGMTLVNAGVFLSGERKVPRTLHAFAIDTVPVTEGAFKKFLQETGKAARHEGPGSRPDTFDNHPAVNVTWHEANEFAEFYGKRLPTLHEWEKAARGIDGRRYPYGNTYKANTGRLRAAKNSEKLRGTAAVGSYPAGASPYGALDMAGSVLEWTSSARRSGERLFRAVKGSCFVDGSPELSRCTSIQYLPPETNEGYLGFRCIKDLE